MDDQKPWWREVQCCAEGPGQECWCPDCACDEDGDAGLSAGNAMVEGFRCGMNQAAEDIRAMHPKVVEAVNKALGTEDHG